MARASASLGASAKLMRVPKWSSGTSRFSAAANSWTFCTPTRNSSGVMKEGIQPSPRRPVRFWAASLLPPIQMGGGFCHGFGKTVTRSSLKNSPW